MRALTIAAGAALIGAIVLGLATKSPVLDAVAITIGGSSCVIAVCVAFYAVGRSEDQQRARDREAAGL